MNLHNLLAPLGKPTSEEVVQPLVSGGAFHLERIVSNGQATPPGQWLIQDRDEWVMLASGSAVLRLDKDAAPITMQLGDYLHIPAGQPHRVESTDSASETVWLALHYDPA